MPLSAGEKLGPYEIITPLGAGGMGEVYRARDSKLGREVAIKVLPAALAQRPDRLARFDREAKVLAAMNHPNIAVIYGLEDRAIVMELVEGPTLADRIAERALPLDESCKIAAQIADALEAAHEKGVVHRDLKPANVKVREDGTVKVLDFGLATAVTSGDREPASSANSPTLTIGSTEAGMILGTAGYMSPEQARGQRVDQRADIWAFGVVLYEMLTGKRLFDGVTVSDTLAQVLTKEPDFNAVPATVRLLLRRCLEKDPKQRLHHIADAMPLIGVTDGVPALLPSQVVAHRWLWPAVSSLLAIGLAPVAFLHFRETPPPAPPTVRFTIPLRDKMTFTDRGVFSISPDGRRLAFSAAGADNVARLWIREMDSLDTRPLAGTEDLGTTPALFWSPDNRFVAFFADGKLKKIDVMGGPPQSLCTVSTNIYGGSWNREGVIVFGTLDGGIMRVSQAGGAASPVTQLDKARKETYHRYPTFLPDGKHFVYLRRSEIAEDNGVAVGTLDASPAGQSAKLLAPAQRSIVYVPPDGAPHGRLLYQRDAALVSQPFDEARLELTGEPVPLADAVGTIGSYGLFSASPGVLMYRGDTVRTKLAWLDRKGASTIAVNGRDLPANESLFLDLVLSPDASRAAITIVKSQSSEIWVVDLLQGTSSRLTSDSGGRPVWSPDGSQIAFSGQYSDGIYRKASNGVGGAESLLQISGGADLSDWSHGFVFFGAVLAPNAKPDLFVLPAPGDGKPFTFLRTPFLKMGSRLSPDGRWLAYLSEESGRREVQVQGFNPVPDYGASPAAGKWTVSRGNVIGGVRWRKDGKELYYLAADGNVMAVEVSANPGFHAGTPTVLFPMPRALLVGGNVRTMWDATSDGTRFLFALPEERDALSEFVVTQNWRPDAR